MTSTNSNLTLAQALDRDPEFRTEAENLMAARIAELEAALRPVESGQAVAWSQRHQAFLVPEAVLFQMRAVMDE